MRVNTQFFFFIFWRITCHHCIQYVGTVGVSSVVKWLQIIQEITPFPYNIILLYIPVCMCVRVRIKEGTRASDNIHSCIYIYLYTETSVTIIFQPFFIFGSLGTYIYIYRHPFFTNHRIYCVLNFSFGSKSTRFTIYNIVL